MASSAITAAIVTHLRGALLLLRLDRRGLGLMDSTTHGAAFSFIAALVAAPFYFAQLLGAPVPESTGVMRSISVHAISYVAQWTVMPLLLYYACMVLGRRAVWAQLVVSYNWLSVWQTLLYLISASMLDSLDATAGTTVPFMLMLLGFYIVGVQGWLYNRVLQSGLLAPILLVVLNMAVDWQLGIARYALLSAGLNNPPA